MKKKKAAEVALLEYTDSLKKALVEVAQTKCGRTVLRHLMHEGGFLKTNITMDPNSREINPLGTIYQEARRDVYLGLREKLPKKLIILIEHENDK